MMVFTHVVNILVILSLMFCIWASWRGYKVLKHKAFIFLALAFLYGLAFRTWLEVDAWVPGAPIYPQTEWGAAQISLMYFFLAIGFALVHRAFKSAKHDFENKYQNHDPKHKKDG